MDVIDIKALHAEVEERMEGVLDHLKRELGGVRTGRASVTLLDPVQVEAYGSLMVLHQVAARRCRSPRRIVAQPFDPTLIGTIEKAVRASNLGLNPANDGKVIRIPLPPSPRSGARKCRRWCTSTPRRAATASARCAATPTIGSRSC